MRSRRHILVGGFALTLGANTPSLVVAQQAKFDTDLSRLEGNDAFSARLGAGLVDQDEQVLTEQQSSKGPAPRHYRRDDLHISPDARRLIVAAEVSSKSAYEAKWRWPTWPHGQSGVTIGIGYDVGYTEPKWVENEWKDYLSSNAIAKIQAACNVRGRPSNAVAAQLKSQSVTIDWHAANEQFDKQLLGLYVGETVRTCPGAELLNGDCLGSLVSLVFNRGGSFGSSSPRFAEMARIAKHVRDQQLDLIPAEFERMKRLWIGKHLPGLLIRRDAEKALFARGLKNNGGLA